MINLKPFRASNTRLFIEEEAKRQNNFFDCDVVHEATMKVADQEATTAQVEESIEYLITAVAYRGGTTKLLKEYQQDYINATA